MNELELEKGEALITRKIYKNKEGYIASVIFNEDGTFGFHIKIKTCTGFVDVVFPLKRLRRFKGII